MCFLGPYVPEAEGLWFSSGYCSTTILSISASETSVLGFRLLGCGGFRVLGFRV